MKKIVFSLLCFVSSLLADVYPIYPDQAFLNKKIPIVDIRTEGEWRQTGVIKGAIPITFFDEKGNYNIPLFLKELSAKVDVKKPFALICRSGSRTKMVSAFLSQKIGYNVYDLNGGMLYASSQGLPIVAYKK